MKVQFIEVQSEDERKWINTDSISRVVLEKNIKEEYTLKVIAGNAYTVVCTKNRHEVEEQLRSIGIITEV